MTELNMILWTVQYSYVKSMVWISRLVDEEAEFEFLQMLTLRKSLIKIETANT